jgi:dimeric dUTPase (all-alpha-NTP-PPase superfamily)
LPRLARDPQPAAMDKLEEIFRMQDALNRRIGVALPPATDEEKAKWVLNYTRALQQETAELIDSVPWKWWAKYQKFDEQNARVEVVDLFHFLVSLAQTLGMSADDVYQAYLKKNQVNHQRQDTGYAQKDEADSKHAFVSGIFSCRKASRPFVDMLSGTSSLMRPIHRSRLATKSTKARKIQGGVTGGNGGSGDRGHFLVTDEHGSSSELKIR